MTVDNQMLEAFQKRLQALQDSLKREIHEQLAEEDSEHYAQVLDVLREGGEVRSAERLHEFNLASVRRHVVELHEVESALERIRSGHYGLCTKCGQTIPIARLDAQPAAQRCIACQTEQEQNIAKEI